MQNCLTQCSQGMICTVLLNTSREEQFIEKGTVIAQISTDVEEVQEVQNMSSLITHDVVKGCSAKNVSSLEENPWKELISISNPAVTQEMKEDFLSRLQEVNSVLPTIDRPLGRYTGVAHEIITSNHPPITCRPHRVPPHKREAIKEACQEMQRLGVASPTTSPWAFPCLLVKKKDGGWRIVADFRKLNDITEKFYFPLPNIDDSIHYIQDARWFTSIDLANAFWQIPMSKESCKKAAFCTPDGNFQYNVMAMGLCNASSTFQAVMNETLSEEQMVICLTFLDDCLIYANTYEELVDRTIRILRKFGNVGLTIKPQKCTWMVNEIDFLGHHLSDCKIEPDKKQISAIMEFPVPRNTKDVRSFVGKCGYYSQFIPAYAWMCIPFYEMFKVDKITKKEVSFKWTEKCQDSFQKLKVALSSKPCLATYCPKLPIQLRTDACDYGIAAILLQNHEDGWHPVAYYSKKLNDSQIRIYTVTEKELFAIIVAIQKFHQYLNQTINVVTDHRALQELNSLKDPKGRLARWSMFLGQYEIICTHRKGTLMGDADCLSRYPVEDPMDEDCESVIFPHFAQTIPSSVGMLFDSRVAVMTAKIASALRKTKQKLSTVFGHRLDKAPVGGYKSFKLQLKMDEKNAKDVHSTEGIASGGTTSDSDYSSDEESKVLRSRLNDLDISAPVQTEPIPVGDSTCVQPVDENWVVNEQTKDEFCINMITLLRNPPPQGATKTQLRNLKQFVLVDKTLFKIRQKQNKLLRFLVIPNSLRIVVLREFHDGLSGGGHSGFHNTYSKIAARFWFPFMKQYIQQYVFSCEKCQQNNVSNKQKKGYLKPILGKRLFEMWGIDILGPLPGSRQGYKNVIVATEYMSRWAVAKAVHEVSRFEVCDFLLENICTIFGFPKQLVTDQGSQFMSELFEDLLVIFEISHLATTAFSPWQNGLTEGFNKDLCRKISKYCNEKQDDWDLYMPMACWWHNTVTNSTTGFSPFEILFGQKPRVLLDHVFDTPLPDPAENIDDYVIARQKQMVEMRDLIMTNMEHRAQRAVDRYDSNRQAPEFLEGDLVWLHDHSILKNKVRKLTGKRTGPWKVERVVSPSQIKVIRGRGKKRDHRVVHPQFLEKYLLRSSEMQEEIRIDDDRRIKYSERFQEVTKLTRKSRLLHEQKQGEVPKMIKPWEEEIRSAYSDDSRIAPPPVPTAQAREPGKRQTKKPERFKVQTWLDNSQGIQLQILPLLDEVSSFSLDILFE